MVFEPTAHAEELAILPLATNGEQPPIAAADDLARELERNGHKTLSGPATLSRLSATDIDAGPSWARKTRQDLDEARAALTRLDRTAATGASDRIAHEIAERGGGEGGAEPLVEWALLQSRLAAAAARPAEARAWIRLAATMLPRGEIDDHRHPEEEREQVAEAQAAALAAVPARVSIESEPQGSEVWIDGTDRCTTPCNQRIVPGHHYARVTSEGHVPVVFELRLSPGTSQKRRVSLPLAYVGPRPDQIALRLGDEAGRAEAARSMVPMTRFLGVEHVIAIAKDGSGNYRVLVSPPIEDHPSSGFTAAPADVSTQVMTELGSAKRNDTESARPWYQKPGFWIGAGAFVAGAIVTGILVSASAHSGNGGTLTVTSP